MENIDINVPLYLYHYTSIEKLALILKNQTIRFTSLDKMDDLQEQKTIDVNNVGQFIYISSWTADNDESIPMWKMYSSLESGVRIRLKTNPFYLYENNADEIQKVTNGYRVITEDENALQSYIPLAEILEKGFISPQVMGGALLQQVVYTNDKEKLYPTIFENEDNDSMIKFGEMGKYKNMYWKFQKEWRYILQILPIKFNQNVNGIFNSFQTVFNNVINGVERQPFAYYDMKIDEDAFKTMEITMSPKISLGNEAILESIVSSYNPTAQIKKSALESLIS